MQRRPSLGSMPTTAKALPPSIYGLTPTTNGERPVWIYSSSTSIPQTFATLNGGINNLIPYRQFVLSAAQTVSVFVTNRQAFLWNEAAGAWVNVTPTYTTGTVAVTNGSPSIVGTGTAWLTRGISPFQHIKIGSRIYQIYQVVDDTHITLSENYAAANASGLAYTITRTWGAGNSTGADRSSAIYCCAYNQTIIIAGALLGRADGIVTPTVIQVSNILSATPTTTYLTSSAALVAGLDTISMNNISGVAVLQDSRVVVSGDQSTIYYSSNLVNTVWSTTPGGFTVVEHYSGAIHAMGWLGSNLTIHFDNGIVYGIPTGQSDPPLNFMDSGATVGCVVSRTLKEFERQLMFLALDGNAWVFDGSTTRPIGDDIKNLFLGSQIESMKNDLFAAVNLKYGEYTIYSYGLSRSWTLTRDGSWWPSKYPAPIGAVSDQDALSGTRCYGLAGVYSLDGASEKNMIWQLNAGGTTDAIIYGGMSAGGHFVELDDQDWDSFIKDAPLTYKNLVAVVVWFRGTQSATENFYVQVSRDGGGTWVDSSHDAIALPLTGEKPNQFSFLDLINAGLMVRFRVVSESPSVMSAAITRVLVTAIQGGDAGLVEL